MTAYQCLKVKYFFLITTKITVAITIQKHIRRPVSYLLPQLGYICSYV